MGKLEDMLIGDGWVEKYYINCGVKYFSWHKDGFEIDEISESDNMREWKPVLSKFYCTSCRTNIEINPETIGMMPKCPDCGSIKLKTHNTGTTEDSKWPNR